MGYRQLEPHLDVEVEREIREWSEGEPKALVSSNYPVYTPSTADAGDILFATRSLDPVAAAAEARRFGLWANAEVTDALWPSKYQRTRPPMPLRKGHMAMLIAAGFLDNLQLEADGRRILVKGKTTKELVLVEETPDKETYRERLRHHRRRPGPYGRRDHRHRCIDDPTPGPHHEAPPYFQMGQRGLAFSNYRKSPGTHLYIRKETDKWTSPSSSTRTRDAIAQRVVESYPPLYRPSQNGHVLPQLIRSPRTGLPTILRVQAFSGGRLVPCDSGTSHLVSLSDTILHSSGMGNRTLPKDFECRPWRQRDSSASSSTLGKTALSLLMYTYGSVTKTCAA